MKGLGFAVNFRPITVVAAQIRHRRLAWEQRERGVINQNLFDTPPSSSIRFCRCQKLALRREAEGGHSSFLSS